MRTLLVSENDRPYSCRMIRRQAWILIENDIQGSGISAIVDVSLRPIAGYERVTMLYPQYVHGRQGEAQYVHLPSCPDRLAWRARTGRLEN